jgi:hypothetical protein
MIFGEFAKPASDVRIAMCQNPSQAKQETPFERFKRLTTQVVSVPRAEIQKRELQWKNGRKQHKSHKRHR